MYTAETDRRQRFLPLLVLVSSTIMYSLLASVTEDNALAWAPLTNIAVRSGLCPNTNAGDPGVTEFSYLIPGTGSTWTLAAWFFLFLTAIVCLLSPHRARRTLQLSLAFSTVAVALYGGGWLESVLLGQPYTERASCDPSPAELQVLVNQGNHFRAVQALAVGSLLLPLLAFVDNSESNAHFGQLRRSSARWWSWLTAGLVTLAAMFFLLGLAAYPSLPGDLDFVVRGLVGFPLIVLILTGLTSLIPLASVRRAGLEGLLAAIGFAFSNLTALVIIERSHQQWSVSATEPNEILLSTDLSDRASENLGAAQDYFVAVLFTLTLVAAASWLINRLFEQQDKLAEVPILLLVGGIAAPADWVKVQRWAWGQGWRNTPSRKHAAHIASAGTSIVYLDFSPKHGNAVLVGTACLEDKDPERLGQLLLEKGKAVGRLQDGGVDFDQVAEALHQQAHGSLRQA